MNKITDNQFFWRLMKEGALEMDVAVHDKVIGWNVERGWACRARQLFVRPKK